MLHILPLFLALLLALTGCAQFSGSDRGTYLPQRPARAAIADFSLDGRIVIQHQQTSYSVNISWQHSAQTDAIMLSTPLGQGIAELTRNTDGMRLVTSEKREYNAPDWSALTHQLFGIDLPLANLPRWLVGTVPAGALGVHYDDSGRPQRQWIDGWLVAYAAYESAAADALPTLIELTREDIQVKLKIDQWLISQ
ncbi:MAG: lipoprotein insertase outer membrane protein LolB [Sterolibacterium sp.]